MIKDQFILSEQQRNVLTFENTLQHMYLCVYVLEETLFRVTLTKEKPDVDIHTWAVAPGDTEVPFEGLDRNNIAVLFSLPDFDITAGPGEYEIETASLKLKINTGRLHCRWYMKTGAGEEDVLIAEDRDTQAYAFQIAETAPTSHYLKRSNSDRYYGFGEKSGEVNKHGERFRMLNIDAMGYDAAGTDPLYKHIPYYITHSREAGVAYGLYYDDYNECLFDMGREKNHYHGRYRYFESRSDYLDYYFILGPGVADVTRRFSWMTGRPSLMPKWSIGYSGSAMTYTEKENSQELLMKFVEDCQKHRIDCRSFHLSSGYTSIGSKRHVFNWNYDKFPDPKQFTDDFHESGIQVIANVKPTLLSDHPQFQEVLDNDYIVLNKYDGPLFEQFWDGMGVHLDFTNENTIAWWKDHVKRQLLAKGVDAVWNDNNEFEVWDLDAHIHLFGQGAKFQSYRAIFPMLMAKSSLEAQVEYNDELRPYVLSRSGSAGLGRYAQTWTGDNYSSWKTLKYNINMSVGLSLSGVYNFGHDTGGFAGNAPGPELFLRWVQSSVYYPRFTIHSWNDDGTVNEPWMYPQIIDRVTEAMRWHDQLAGYIFSLLYHSSATYEPVIKPTFFDFADDDHTYEENDEFMLGEHLLVCTMVRPEERERTVYLPEYASGWYDMYTGRWYEGGWVVTVPAPLAYTPVMVKGGSLIPVEENEKHVIDLYVYPGENGAETSFTYYDDDNKRTHPEQLLITWIMVPGDNEISLTVEREGTYNNGFTAMQARLPAGETRPVTINGTRGTSFAW